MLRFPLRASAQPFVVVAPDCASVCSRGGWPLLRQPHRQVLLPRADRCPQLGAAVASLRLRLLRKPLHSICSLRCPCAAAPVELMHASRFPFPSISPCVVLHCCCCRHTVCSCSSARAALERRFSCRASFYFRSSPFAPGCPVDTGSECKKQIEGRASMEHTTQSRRWPQLLCPCGCSSVFSSHSRRSLSQCRCSLPLCARHPTPPSDSLLVTIALQLPRRPLFFVRDHPRVLVLSDASSQADRP